MLGITKLNGKQAKCASWGVPPYIFGTSGGTQAKTLQSDWMVGHWLGDPSNPLVTMIDTPGTGDTEGRDCEHGIELANTVKQISSINAFLFLFKEMNMRFSESMQAQLFWYQNMFGQKMFKNAITEFTFWGHTLRESRTRLRSRNTTEENRHRLWNKEYKKRFFVNETIPSVFVDPVYVDDELTEDREREMWTKYTTELWELVTFRPPFTCDSSCNAPSGYLSGLPWLVNEETAAEQKKRLGDSVFATWQIWVVGCKSPDIQSYEIKKKSPDGFETTLFKYIDSVGGEEPRHNEAGLLQNMNVTDDSKTRDTQRKFKTIRFEISETLEEHFGEYYVENERGRSTSVNLLKVVDGEWQAWSSYGTCTKECISGSEEPGTMNRTRVCSPPQNGGRDCPGNATYSKACAALPGGNTEIFRFSSA